MTNPDKMRLEFSSGTNYSQADGDYSTMPIDSMVQAKV